MVEHDWYKILGVEPTADLETIKNAFRRRAFQCHPDRGGSHDEMVLVLKAWEILSDPAKRRRYDAARAGANDAAAQEAAARDAAEAGRNAEQYAPRWEDFEKWLNSIRLDITGARYGETFVKGYGNWCVPTVGDSFSGKVSLALGVLIGAGVLFWLFMTRRPSQGSVHVLGVVLLLLIGGTAGAWIGVGLHA